MLKSHRSLCVTFSRTGAGLLLLFLFLLLTNFLHQRSLFFFFCFFVFFYLSLSDYKSPLVSRTLLSILADLNYSVVWIVSILRLIFSSSSLFSKAFQSVPSAPTTTSITFTLMFHGFFLYFSGKVQVFLYLFTFFYFYSMLHWKGKAKST